MLETGKSFMEDWSGRNLLCEEGFSETHRDWYSADFIFQSKHFNLLRVLFMGRLNLLNWGMNNQTGSEFYVTGSLLEQARTMDTVATAQSYVMWHKNPSLITLFMELSSFRFMYWIFQRFCMFELKKKVPDSWVFSANHEPWCHLWESLVLLWEKLRNGYCVILCVTLWSD